MTELDKSILSTIIYFDLLGYPLTVTEIWRWLWKPGRLVSLPEVEQVLAQSQVLQQRLNVAEAFYSLRGRESLIPERKQANLRADLQMRHLRSLIGWFRWLPSLRAVFISSSIARGNVHPEGDIDLVILAKRQHLWLIRFIIVTVLKFSDKRPRPGKTRDSLCLSLYIADTTLNLKSLRLDHDDLVFYYYVEGFVPIIDPDNYYQKMLQANQWVYEALPNANWAKATIALLTYRPWHHWWRALFSPLMNVLVASPFNDWVIRLQLSIMPERLKSLANIDTRVVVSDDVLKFHDKDSRQEMKQRWQRQLSGFR